MLRRTATLADGWLPLFNPDESTSDEMIDPLRDDVREAGRQESEVGLEGRINPANAAPDDWRRQFGNVVSEGATHIGVASDPRLSRLDDHIGALRSFKEVVGACLPAS